jgi:hypothetical protein
MSITHKYINAKKNKKRLNEYFNEVRDHNEKRENTLDHAKPIENVAQLDAFFKAELKKVLRQRKILLTAIQSAE